MNAYEWQPISTAPKFGPVLLYGPILGVMSGWRCDEMTLHVGGKVANPTHWMPLPSPPEVEGGKDRP